jgi:hypothetical protein
VKDKDDDQGRRWIPVRDWREGGAAIVCLATGFALATLIFGSPWHLPPAWGDIPTWILAVGAILGGIVALINSTISESR